MDTRLDLYIYKNNKFIRDDGVTINYDGIEEVYKTDNPEFLKIAFIWCPRANQKYGYAYVKSSDYDKATLIELSNERGATIIINTKEDAYKLGADYIDYLYIVDCFSNEDNYIIYKCGDIINSINKNNVSIDTILHYLQ